MNVRSRSHRSVNTFKRLEVGDATTFEDMQLAPISRVYILHYVYGLTRFYIYISHPYSSYTHKVKEENMDMRENENENDKREEKEEERETQNQSTIRREASEGEL